MKVRVSTKGIRAGDIRIKGLLTTEQISSIPEVTVFQWVAEKHWNYKDFQKWLNAVAPYED